MNLASFFSYSKTKIFKKLKAVKEKVTTKFIKIKSKSLHINKPSAINGNKVKEVEYFDDNSLISTEETSSPTNYNEYKAEQINENQTQENNSTVPEASKVKTIIVRKGRIMMKVYETPSGVKTIIKN